MNQHSPLQEVIEERHVEIPLPDGCILAARIWRPADGAPVPAIFEYLPYRKGDGTLARDAVRAPYIAARGYAYVRVDLRGTGESEGLMVDEYTAQELQDGCDVIAWIAAQDWCDGGVGMVGISWGGFNGLQVAALQPPALKAVVSIASTDDRYADDVHYMGGTMVVDQISWASHMFAINTLPPDPDLVGEKWREMWMQRLTGSGLWLKNWAEHQRRDEFWKHGSVCEDISRIQVPVYAVSGWADGYCRTVFRLMESLQGPKKGLVGPWSHKYPHIGVPGPAIDWNGEELRWWDQWLKGIATGIMDEPQLRLYMQDHAEPASFYAHRGGRWIEEPSWPSPNVERTGFALGADGSLGREDVPTGTRDIRSPLGTGIAGGKWCSYAKPGDQPVDQRRDDAGSLVFETAPLAAPLEIAGDTNLELSFTVDQPVAQVAARLVDVAPDGAATRVSYGLLNLTHRDSHETPEALVPGEVYTATVPFKHVAQTFRAGHRLRLAISTSYFPIAWPSPEPVTLRVDTAASRLVLPLRAATDAPEPRDLGTPEGAAPMERDVLAAGRSDWVVSEDLATGETVVRITDDDGRIRIADNGLTTGACGVETYSFSGTDWRSFKGHVVWDLDMSRGDWRMSSRTETEMTATATHFVIKAKLVAKEGETIAHEQEWFCEIPRDLA
ncbi:CocE/NonD family hydrolase [Salipiger sp. PrR003]|uniref:CocE/NonD family hydrolase n=1 Tax=Salipiger sp. PrR003 TaxID=2706776 RepID=UPI0013DAEB70|nr:CocE/NonD family hydrolase [Salipiger sp. PrR003]NDV53027.1 CocE/NonD family hydrolase [Salipiger sp. PrR003]